MMCRLTDGEGVQFERQIGMAGRDHFVINQLISPAKMTGEAHLCTDIQLLCICHPLAYTVRMSYGQILWRIALHLKMRPQPIACRTVACLASDAVGKSLLRRSDNMANRAARVRRGVGDFENLYHSLAAGIAEHDVGARVFVSDRPCREFVTQNPALGLCQRRGTAMAIR